MEPEKKIEDTKDGVLSKLNKRDPGEFPIEEFNDIARSLEIHNSIFSKLWNLGKPSFTFELDTAGVYFDRVGKCIDFKVNPDFWATLTRIQKRFVISHECLHVILFHGMRQKNLKTDNEKLMANLAMDVVVNHSLVERFGFARVHVDIKKQVTVDGKETQESDLCWVDTVFPENTPKRGSYFEFYYNLLKKEQQQQPNGGSGKPEKGDGKGTPGNGMRPLDDHSGLDDFVSNEFNETLEENLNEQEFESMKGLAKEHIKDIEKEIEKELKKKEDEKGNSPGGKQAGTAPGCIWSKATIKKIQPKKKWETIIRKWSRKYAGEKENDQWAHKNRRMQLISDEFMLPSDKEVDLFKKERIQVWFFQDTSGSCSSFMQRFFDCARSLPKDKFDVKMHCFDTSVYEVSLEEGKLAGFGGTTFTCIEQYIQTYIKKNKLSYPKAVFVITDGYGDVVKPERPENWYWFIDGSFSMLPEKSKKYNLKDFE